jgi:fermentation-respiration switch protein FrsA (DUF1100 family)
MFERTELTFDSGGVDCAAYLYRPTAAGEVPCVVMAHGFAATRDDGLPAYAQRFAEAGLAVLLFDYRHFGTSGGGEPRQLVDVGHQHEDYHAAIRCARHLDGADPDRIVLWGSSFSGGHVIAVAAGDSRVAAVISQVPYADGLIVAWQTPPPTMLRLAAAGVQDAAGHFGIYQGEMFAQVVADQVDFLRRHGLTAAA